MRLLLNENFPTPSVARLRQADMDVVAIEETKPGIRDQEVMAWAVEDEMVIVTFDTDYGELIFGKGLPPPPAVILLRVASYRPQEPAHWVIDLCRDESQLRGRFHVFDGTSLRSRPFLQRV